MAIACPIARALVGPEGLSELLPELHLYRQSPPARGPRGHAGKRPAVKL